MSIEYGFTMPDDSMEPEYSAGDMLLIDSSQEVVPGLSYVFYGSENGSEIVTIRRLVSIQADHYVVKTFRQGEGEPRHECLEADKWTEVHFIVGHLKQIPDIILTTNN